MLPRQFTPDEITELDPFSLVSQILTKLYQLTTSKPLVSIQPCFVIASKVIMREIVRMRRVPPDSQDYTHPRILTEELNRILSCLDRLTIIYPVIGENLIVSIDSSAQIPS